MDDRFSASADAAVRAGAPLAARMRPRTLDEFVGQAHVLGEGSALRSLIEADELRSVILWGPAGSGKTTLAQIVAHATRSSFQELSATSAGVKDVRAVLAAARELLGAVGRRTVLFIDEIHRFNKAQQDALLPGVEDRTVVLVGATTENPFFTVNAPLLSRSLLFRLEPLATADLETIVRRALADEERGLGGRGLTLDPDADVEDALQRPRVVYDRAGDQHYDVASAFIKSIRGSDPDAALHYLARMLTAGEDPRFIARRMVISASEDVGLADPQALGVAVAAFQALEFVGLPEAQLNLAEAVVYLALAPKSNSTTKAIAAATRELEEAGAGRVPAHLQSASHPGERRLGIGAGYAYPHDHPGHWVRQRYLPEALKGGYYQPSDQGREPRLAASWRERDTLRPDEPPASPGPDRAAGGGHPQGTSPRPSPDREEPTP
jgi:putative ATPase